jgi:hypothetical protein
MRAGQTPDIAASGSLPESPPARWLASLSSYTRGYLNGATPDAGGVEGPAGAVGGVRKSAENGETAGVSAGIEPGTASFAAYMPTLDGIKGRLPTFEGIKDSLPR